MEVSGSKMVIQLIDRCAAVRGSTFPGIAALPIAAGTSRSGLPHRFSGCLRLRVDSLALYPQLLIPYSES